MQAKQYMQMIREAEIELKLINAKRQHYIDLAASMGAGIGKVSDTPSTGSRVETAAIGMADLLTELNVKAREYEGMIRKAEALISKIPQERFRQLLTYRYFCNWSWSHISDELGYKDPKSVYRVHGWALRELQAVM
jgi:hypothetical protein